MKILAGTKVWLSEFGEKGFIYPSNKEVELTSDLEVTKKYNLFSGNHLLVSVVVTVSTGDFFKDQIIWLIKA